MSQRLVMVALLASLLLCAQPHGPMEEIHSVYLLPMANGLHQYLANHLTAQGVFQVSTDPGKADAVFTDSIGPAFELRMKELYPPEVKSEKTGEQEKKAQEGEQPAVSSFGRGKGTIFLVSRRTRTVLWSVYEQPKNATPAELDRTAQRIAKRLKQSLAPKRPRT